MKKLVAYLSLLRPANIVTAFADILLGFGIAAIPLLNAHQWLYLLALLTLLLVTTACLYAGGVVYNDVCDADLDRVERPERPIPSGIISKRNATNLTFVLFVVAIILASMVSWVSGLIAAIIAVLSVFYDMYAKHSLWLGPIVMGSCRGANVLLGLSIIAGAISVYWPVALLPFIYICGVTLVSKGEVHGSNKVILMVALLCYILAVIGFLLLFYFPNFNLMATLPFLILFIVVAFVSLLRGIVNPSADVLRIAVKVGIISLIVLDAGIATGFAGWFYGVLILLLIPITVAIGHKFSVT